MRGFCESCSTVVESVPDDQGGDVCPTCGDDVHPGVHVEGGWECGTPDDGDEYTEADFDEWLLKE